MNMGIRSVVLCAAMLLPAIAMAEPKTADDWYSEGETQYNLGNFDKAADAFKQGYALESVEKRSRRTSTTSRRRIARAASARTPRSSTSATCR